MLLEFDIKKLDRAIFDFYNATGVGSISVLGEDFSPLGARKGHNPYCRLIQSSKKGLAECLKSNRFLLEGCKQTKKPMMQICHAGLVEMVVPILYRNEAIGYVMLGHIRMSDIGDVKARIRELPVEAELAEEIFKALPAFEEERIKSIMNMAEMLGKYIILENLVHPKENENLERIKNFVQENLDKRLTAQLISRGVHISKSSLYNLIHANYGYTVSEYINDVKIEKAKELLMKTDMPVEDISEKLAFSSPAYFGKVFKRSVGISPLKFRKTYLFDN